MKTTTFTRFMLTGAILSFSAYLNTVYASMYCGTNLVQEGTHYTKVIDWCGEPTNADGTLLGLDELIYKRSDVTYTLTIGNDKTVANISTAPNF